MQWALGVLQWSPKQFWSATPIELEAALKGWKLANGVANETNNHGKEILSKEQVDHLQMLIDEQEKKERWQQQNSNQ